ncbi:hypothetical protein IU453_16125 [Nocardia cyriacigeorgica]|uniref:hypothetical protein n=1 Tax=Nocardia cyriacigeorgica TaxID=135487 RepID=UPI001895DD03|nr:hypothetical protein [Nocardia cyriacigeorgica]MBF6157488.1 hypothetical protein [Nocardia cyriacigeorgica]MBF6196459.1 hypothetical protein [Nocardia cyriacigeorgica]MBF6318289.1 hypothetical protein [Nocardia cyriacigeorgica]MBF6534043.1 hypothetical protein [Nocardia cyriacigeorgica]
MKAVVYLNSSYCKKRQQGYEMESRAYAARHGYSVARTVIDIDNDALAWLLLKTEQLGIAAIVTPTLDHLGSRAQSVLDRCDLLIVYPSGFLARGTRLARAALGGRR